MVKRNALRTRCYSGRNSYLAGRLSCYRHRVLFLLRNNRYVIRLPWGAFRLLPADGEGDAGAGDRPQERRYKRAILRWRSIACTDLISPARLAGVSSSIPRVHAGANPRRAQQAVKIHEFVLGVVCAQIRPYALRRRRLTRLGSIRQEVLRYGSRIEVNRL